MKNKYIFWTICCLSLMGCKEISCDFSYTPSQPLAGGIVTFVNASVGADDYQWTFGDNGTATSSSPTHIYKKPGTYVVTLQIKRNKVQKRSCTHQIVIYDTVPTIAMSADSIYTFTPITFSAQIYNPWKKSITCHWTLPQQAVVMSWGTDSTSVKCYFREEVSAATIQLDIKQDDVPYALTRTEKIYHAESTSLLFTQNGQNYEQFIYNINGELYQDAQHTGSQQVKDLLDAEQDQSVQLDNTTTLTTDSVSKLLKKTVWGFQYHRTKRKIYARGKDTLWVCNLNATHPNARALLVDSISAIKVDGANNRLYWATQKGLFTSRLIGMNDNSDEWKADTINSQTNISRISVYLTKH